MDLTEYVRCKKKERVMEGRQDLSPAGIGGHAEMDVTVLKKGISAHWSGKPEQAYLTWPPLWFLQKETSKVGQKV